MEEQNSKSWQALPPGLYERLIDDELARLLESEPLVKASAAVDPADAPHVLTTHLAARIESALEQTQEGERLALANKLLGLLPEPTKLFSFKELSNEGLEIRATSPEQLLSLTEGAAAEPPERPEIPLSDIALLTNGPHEPGLAAEIIKEMKSADCVDLLGSFIKWTGVRTLLSGLESLARRGVPIRVLTTTYIGATERKALDELARLGAQIRVNYHSASTKLHAKAWIFHRRSGYSTAYIGSSNLSRSAMTDGIEWNVRVSEIVAAHVLEKFNATFDSYWSSNDYEQYDPSTDRGRLDEALQSARSISSGTAPSPAGTVSSLLVRPYPHQQVILDELEAERVAGRHANLVVAATGTGKTVIAALDYQRISQQLPTDTPGILPRLLFVAHRQEILEQSRRIYRDVLRDGSFGELFVAGHRPQHKDHVFASVQSLQNTMATFDPDHFDVLVIDEFHHAEASSYRRVLEHFRPKELLGLTATPERADGVNVATEFFGGRVASELRLWDALDAALLVPFHYFGIADGTDLSRVTFRRGQYDQSELAQLYIDDRARASKIVENTTRIVTDVHHMKALGFCVSVEHAHFMAEFFTESGIPAVALHGGSSKEVRADALAALRAGEVNALFAVDLFNEGLDIPEIDTVIMARPTQSATIFLQQLGRGLRRTPTKPVLTVLDFVGHQHANFRFDIKLRALTGLGRAKLRKAVEADFPFLPAGSQIILDRVTKTEVIESLKSTLALSARELTKDIRDHAGEQRPYSLRSYLDDADRSLSDVYGAGAATASVAGRKIPRSWQAFSSLAFDGGAKLEQASLFELDLLKRIRAFTHVNDVPRIAAYRRILSELALSADTDEATEAVNAMGNAKSFVPMLFYSLWPTGAREEMVEKLVEVAKSRILRDEISEVLNVREEISRTLARPLEGKFASLPIQSHARYSREELLAGFGLGTLDSEKPGNVREGVKHVKELDVDLLLITLKKSEADYSPSTMYRDYAISPTRFHWESQSTTGENSPTGQRYIHHESRGSGVVLFVREAKTGDLGTEPYTCLGTARYVGHAGSKPMAIEWELDRPMPADLLSIAKLVA
ncbi:superfamily II DNA or RNA helicase/HKD family nuclease [Trueperella bonasi]|uniref:Superfamily II DNA or RNA helicase/HKD family nuclease n=1 Tax=Trueperella bonasi TaxID=312286 RepID=A0ABT9NF38_9ACTO|nr:DUF3427 domain-containing protein [Trueperella bonasi]MDP9805812.1 superfamily II DNA or RNA helicase/HKD family nuclease [Trueperella bonasi]